VVIDRLSPEERAGMYFVLVAEPAQQLYGHQATGFADLLAAGGYPHLLIETKLSHGWVQVRQEMPAAIAAWAGRMVATGVF
jgi:hypothetical protein